MNILGSKSGYLNISENSKVFSILSKYFAVLFDYFSKCRVPIRLVPGTKLAVPLRNAGSDPVPVFEHQFRFRVPSGYFRA